LQLGVNDFLWKKSPETAKLINRGGKLNVKLRTPIVHMKLTQENLKQPKAFCLPRWNTVPDMLERLLTLEEFCKRMQDVTGFEQLKMPETSWRQIEKLVKLLKIPAKLTTLLQSESLLVTDFIYGWKTMVREMALIKTPQSKLLLSCLENRGKSIFQNPVVLAGW
jgi:hypothetical protein